MRWRSSHDVPKSRLRPRLAKPAPTQTPSTLAITGTGQPWTATTASPSTRIPSTKVPVPDAAAPPPPLKSPLPPRSAPAQKSPSAPVRITAREPEYAISRNTSPRATHMIPVHAFFASGRSIITVVTCPSCSTRMLACDLSGATGSVIAGVLCFGL